MDHIEEVVNIPEFWIKIIIQLSLLEDLGKVKEAKIEIKWVGSSTLHKCLKMILLVGMYTLMSSTKYHTVDLLANLRV